MLNPFSTEDMAEGYAKARPPLHAQIVKRLVELLNLRSRVRLALDLGCGSGLSTLPLLSLAHTVIGIEPNPMMTVRAQALVPAARFITGCAEALPLPARSVDFIAAAGSLNYTRLDDALDQAARVLRDTGVLCAYDFLQGRRFRSSDSLAAWFDMFESRYPRPPGEALVLNPDILGHSSPKFQSVAAETLDLAVPMTSDRYVDYLTTETNVAAAVRNGKERAEILDWLRDSLAPVFRNNTEEVLFSGYLVCLRPCSGH